VLHPSADAACDGRWGREPAHAHARKGPLSRAGPLLLLTAVVVVVVVVVIVAGVGYLLMM
jgi:hypothetical protein